MSGQDYLMAIAPWVGICILLLRLIFMLLKMLSVERSIANLDRIQRLTGSSNDGGGSSG